MYPETHEIHPWVCEVHVTLLRLPVRVANHNDESRRMVYRSTVASEGDNIIISDFKFLMTDGAAVFGQITVDCHSIYDVVVDFVMVGFGVVRSQIIGISQRPSQAKASLPPHAYMPQPSIAASGHICP